MPRNDEYVVRLCYEASRFSYENAKRLVTSYVELADSASAAPSDPIASVW
jgi:hypothetical protein